jgi:hypothetical protein
VIVWKWPGNAGRLGWPNWNYRPIEAIAVSAEQTTKRIEAVVPMKCPVAHMRGMGDT